MVKEKVSEGTLGRMPVVPKVLDQLPDGGRILPLLSPRQAQALDYVYTYSLTQRDYPSGPEIASRLGISKQAVTTIVNQLVAKGYLFRDRNVAQRNIRLTDLAVERMQLENGKTGTKDLF